MNTDWCAQMSSKAEVAIIGGTGLESLLKNPEQIRIGTPYGFPSPLQIGVVDDKKVAFLQRHGPGHSLPPHRVNYRANIYALHEVGVERIIATNAVGAINLDFKPADLVVPHDLIDFTRSRHLTFYDEAPVTHVDFSQPYCPEIRNVLIGKSKRFSENALDRAVYVCTEGPRYETPAEIRMFRQLGGDVVGMTGVPEVVLAREVGICYAALCFISNMAAGIENKLTTKEVIEVSKSVMQKIQQTLIETIRELPKDRRCPCGESLKEARV